ncbi:hypothetical protein [Pelagicoccus mobilis]|uniref:Uncharacterized protein n=1 Tax=Pelagicoccus mobilis TaxID=415221 RepID=A0A934VU21_9BACT|nr:hypothetical protein [Pelagicoccus mobilis]MBK1880313.1 hypothetical protein [Pelagicoccus mobilis]
MTQLGALVCFLTILMANGIHTAAIQTYAWGKMFDAYNKAMPTLQAIELTFSGEELCGICEFSKEFRDCMNESVALSLSDSKPLLHQNASEARVQTPPNTFSGYGALSEKQHQEIILETDPPPPRFA